MILVLGRTHVLLPNVYYLAFLKEILGQMIYKEVGGGSLGKANT